MVAFEKPNMGGIKLELEHSGYDGRLNEMAWRLIRYFHDRLIAITLHPKSSKKKNELRLSKNRITICSMRFV